LAGIPTVVYGFFALTVITPGLQIFHKGFQSFNVTGAGIAVGILCLPIVSSLVEDALRAVPRSLREGAYGLGATKFEVSTKVVVPAALSGTGWMVQMALGDVSNYDLSYLSMYAVAAVLFVITLLLTFAGNFVRMRFREEYQ